MYWNQYDCQFPLRDALTLLVQRMTNNVISLHGPQTAARKSFYFLPEKQFRLYFTNLTLRQAPTDVLISILEHCKIIKLMFGICFMKSENVTNAMFSLFLKLLLSKSTRILKRAEKIHNRIFLSIQIFLKL